jgi:DNA-binding winged helix-turn-helix (wHTH) protein/tetratricopeptide (TPR) repeat protein
MPVGRTRYRFGLFEADPQDGRLFRQGEPVRLQEQPFQVLIALLERHGDVVTRDEFRQRLWPGDTFVEFDKSLGVALTKVRAALGDEAANPRFIETMPKRGYRFIAPVTVETAAVQATVTPAGTEISAAPTPISQQDPAASVPPRVDRFEVEPSVHRPMRGRAAGVMGLLVVALAIIAMVMWRSHAAAPPTGRVSVVIAEFNNTTGDPVFVGSLRRAASVALRQSPFLSVMEDGTIANTLQALGRAPNDTLTASLARDVCTHAQDNVLVDGDISLAADTYTLVIEATRCGSGDSVARETQTFTKKDDALPALGRALEHVRTALGESRESLQAYDVPVAVSTTDSIEALRAFNLGMDLRSRADNLRAIPALKTAIALDPHFALAYAQLGSAYSNTGDEIEGAPYLIKAFDLRDRATEPERLFITGRYFDIITREVEKAMETYRLWTGLYPSEWLPYNALANDANLIGRYDVAVQAATRGVALDPTHLFPRVNLMTAYAGANKLNESAEAARGILARAPDNVSAHIALYAIARHAGDEAAVGRELAWAAQHPSETGMLYIQAEDAGLHGRFAEMTRLFRDTARQDRGANAEGAGNTLAYNAIVNSFAGRSEEALADAAAAAALGHNEIILGLVGVVDARAGRTDAAAASLKTMNSMYPLSTYAIGMDGPMTRGALVARGSPSAADVTNAMSAALPYEWGQDASLLPPYLRGLGYMAAHAPDLALVEFQKLIDHVGVDPVSPLYAMSYLGVARANAAMGKREDSRKAYDTLTALWAHADRDAPIVKAALSEAAQSAAAAR